MSFDVADELEMVLGMYSDECTPLEDARGLVTQLPFGFVLQIDVSSQSYPDVSYPALFITTGPNAQLVSDFSAELHQRMRANIIVGSPMLVELLQLSIALAEEMKEKKAAEAAQAADQHIAWEEERMHAQHQQLASSVELRMSEIISDRKSRFLAHIAPVSSVEEVRMVVQHLRSDRHIAAAAHPTIWAYRFTDACGLRHMDSDDDGETGAAVKMLFLLDHLKVDGYVVVVTRWFGGILLGPDRFKHIMDVTRQVLDLVTSKEEGGGTRGNKK